MKEDQIPEKALGSDQLHCSIVTFRFFSFDVFNLLLLPYMSCRHPKNEWLGLVSLTSPAYRVRQATVSYSLGFTIAHDW